MSEQIIKYQAGDRIYTEEMEESERPSGMVRLGWVWVPADPESAAKINLEGMQQTGPDSYEIETPGYEPQPEPHQHTFQFLMNANHNALRGCTTCGATWVGYMAGGPDTLHWHPVAEIEETQEQD